MNKNTIIFDFDNTIVDSLKYWYYEMNKTIFRIYGLKPDKRIVELRKGKNNKEIAEIFLKLSGLIISIDEVYDCWYNLMYKDYTTKIKIIPGAREFINSLKKQGKRLILATATNIDLVKKVLPHFDLDIFDEIHTEQTLKSGKNNVKFFENLLNTLQVNPEDILFFEDSFESIQNARKFNIECCAVIHKYNKKHIDYFNKNCKLVIKNYKDKKLSNLNI